MKFDRSNLPPAKLLVSILFSAGILAGAFVVLSPFMLAILWAAILAVATWPMHESITRRLGPKRGHWAAGCSTAVVLLFRKRIIARYSRYLTGMSPRKTFLMTVLVGAILGVLVSISSVGAGAIGVTALILLYPHLPMARIVGSDIAHAVPLTLIAGAGHWFLGLTDLSLLSSLLVGSIPGIILGSYAAPRMPDTALRYMLAGTLVLVGGRLVL